MFATLWSKYFTLSICHSKLDSTCTPSGIHGIMIVVIGCLRYDLGTYCLYFFSNGSWLNFYNLEDPPLDVIGILNILLQEFQDWYIELSRKNNVYAVNELEW